jgi:hypothetical protein
MPDKEGYYRFPPSVRKQVREEQQHTCAFCGAAGCLEVHHILPSIDKESMNWTDEQIIDRTNAVALCAGEGQCHETFNILARKYSRYFDEVMEAEGRTYLGVASEAAVPRILSIQPQREISQLYATGNDD